MNIKSKLLWSHILLILLSTFLFGVVMARRSNKIFSEEINNKNQKISSLILDIVKTRNDLLFSKVSTDLKYAEDILGHYGPVTLREVDSLYSVNNHSLFAGDENLFSFSEYLDNIEDVTGATCSIFLLQNDKLIRITTNVESVDGISPRGTYIEKNDEIFESITKKMTYSGVVKLGGYWYIAGYTPLIDDSGNVIGAIGLGHKQLNDYLKDTISDIKIGDNGYVYIMNDHGDLLLHPKDMGSNIRHHDFIKKIRELKNGSITYTYNGEKKLANFTYFPQWEWYIVSTAPYDDINAPLYSLLAAIFMIGSFILILGFIVSSIITSNIVRPISTLKHSMEEFSKGNRDVRVTVHSKDEIGILSETFNTLVSENNKLINEVQKQSEIKTEFFSNVSHELKTPLNIISSANQLIEKRLSMESEISPEQFKTLTNNIHQNSLRLLKLVNNLIDIPRLDSGNLSANFLNVNVVEVVENVTMSTLEYVESKGRTLIFDTNTEELLTSIDPDLIERILLNLISNATKFTSPGDQIFVTFSDLGGSVCISVKDTGIGIPYDKQKVIFDRFSQVDRLLNRNHEGSGIGLSIVKSIVDLHKGSISLKSKPGVGSEFIITLPHAPLSNGDVILDYSSYSSNEKTAKQTDIEFSDIYS